MLSLLSFGSGCVFTTPRSTRTLTLLKSWKAQSLDISVLVMELEQHQTWCGHSWFIQDRESSVCVAFSLCAEPSWVCWLPECGKVREWGGPCDLSSLACQAWWDQFGWLRPLLPPSFTASLLVSCTLYCPLKLLVLCSSHFPPSRHLSLFLCYFLRPCPLQDRWKM